MYDETGIVLSEEDAFASFSTYEEFENYWRLLFPKLTEKKIDDFLAKYIGSEEEKIDLKKLYVQFEGDLNKIINYHIGYEDDERIVNLIQEMIDADEIPAFDAFTKESTAKRNKRRKRIERDRVKAAKENTKRQKTSSENTDDDLVMAIQKRNQNREQQQDDFFARLEAKYAKPKKNGGRRK